MKKLTPPLTGYQNGLERKEAVLLVDAFSFGHKGFCVLNMGRLQSCQVGEETNSLPSPIQFPSVSDLMLCLIQVQLLIFNLVYLMALIKSQSKIILYARFDI